MNKLTKVFSSGLFLFLIAMLAFGTSPFAQAVLMGGEIQNGNIALGNTSAASAVMVSTLAGFPGAQTGADGTGAMAQFGWGLQNITTDGNNLYVTASNMIRKIVKSTSVVTTLAGRYMQGSLDGTGMAALFANPYGITTDGTNLYVTDNGNQTVRKIVISSGVVTTLAGSAGASGSTDGTGTAARFNSPQGITTDGTNLYVTDSQNQTIRKIVISSGLVTTLAGTAGTSGSTDGTGTTARFYSPIAITTDGTNLYVTDSGNQTIRKIVISSGVVTTLAGSAGASGSTDGTGTAARFNSPQGITTDGTNLYVTDTNNQTIRKIVISSGVVTTLAGTAGVGYLTNGTGTDALFWYPLGITTDGTNLYVTDTANYIIRTISTIVNSLGTGGGTSLSFVAGWNLVGNSVDTPLSVSTDFGNTSSVSTVWKWQTKGNNPNIIYPAWAFYAPSLSTAALTNYAASKGYDVLTTINAGEGFWVNANVPFTTSLPSGMNIITANFKDAIIPPNPLPSGWSLIAVGDSPTPRNFTGEISLNPPATGTTVAPSLITLWAWDSASMNWYFYAPGNDNAGTLTSYINGKGYLDFTAKGKTLDPATGFWVNHP